MRDTPALAHANPFAESETSSTAASSVARRQHIHACPREVVLSSLQTVGTFYVLSSI
jgi:hypothetical protein